jgi:hypothetical protein
MASAGSHINSKDFSSGLMDVIELETRRRCFPVENFCYFGSKTHCAANRSTYNLPYLQR